MQDLLVATAVTGAFVTLAVYLVGFTAAMHAPPWYRSILHSHPDGEFALWSLMRVGIPNGLLACACAAVLARLTRSSARVVAAS